MELITGASGYIGGRLMKRLVSDGRPVRALARTPAKLAGEPVEVARGDVLSGEGLEAALDGCHTAYYLVPSMAPAAAPSGARPAPAPPTPPPARWPAPPGRAAPSAASTAAPRRTSRAPPRWPVSI